MESWRVSSSCSRCSFLSYSNKCRHVMMLRVFNTNSSFNLPFELLTSRSRGRLWEVHDDILDRCSSEKNNDVWMNRMGKPCGVAPPFGAIFWCRIGETHASTALLKHLHLPHIPPCTRDNLILYLKMYLRILPRSTMNDCVRDNMKSSVFTLWIWFPFSAGQGVYSFYWSRWVWSLTK